MFASKEACVREIVGRVLDSRLNDEEAVLAVFNIIKAYRENPNAFGNFRDMVEPLDLSTAFQWGEAGWEQPEYWQNVNSAVVGVFHEISEAGDFPTEEEEVAFEFGLDEDESEDEVLTTYYGAIGPMVEGWGLFNKATSRTAPVFCESRQEARNIKDSGDKVVRVAMFTVAG